MKKQSTAKSGANRQREAARLLRQALAQPGVKEVVALHARVAQIQNAAHPVYLCPLQHIVSSASSSLPH
jgi:hypothetical protein